MTFRPFLNNYVLNACKQPSNIYVPVCIAVSFQCPYLVVHFDLRCHPNRSWQLGDHQSQGTASNQSPFFFVWLYLVLRENLEFQCYQHIWVMMLHGLCERFHSGAHLILWLIIEKARYESRSCFARLQVLYCNLTLPIYGSEYQCRHLFPAVSQKCQIMALLEWHDLSYSVQY